ncbi:MAG TPA: hypothetical protein PKK01_04485, partial [Mycobacterium sp.]|nr:hypothetical protein [Mycobacterium sp.]HPZ94379.1 hypothetical protein [Mycobacterium sp.]
YVRHRPPLRAHFYVRHLGHKSAVDFTSARDSQIRRNMKEANAGRRGALRSIARLDALEQPDGDRIA